MSGPAAVAAPFELRMELKFPLSTDELHELRFWHRGEGSRFRRAYPARRINSLYFDSPDLDSYLDNLAGISERRKVRLRWYGEAAPETVRFEVKERRNECGAKLVHVLGSGRLEIEPLRSLARRLRSALPPELRPEVGAAGWPALGNRYEREYYASPGGTRLTIDTGIEFSALRRGWRASRFERSPHAAVVEVKFAPEMRRDAVRLLRSFPFRWFRSSKYVDSLEQVL